MSSKLICGVCGYEVTGSGVCPYCNGSESGPSPVVEVVGRAWVLGAPDPEMAAIESLLRECGEAVVYAAVDDVRVHPGNAYRSDWPAVDGALVLIECGFRSPDDGELTNIGSIASIDHHKPGDPGYGRGPEEFLPASSVGQVLEFLSREGLLPGPCGALLDHGAFSPAPFLSGGEWVQDVAWSGGMWYRRAVPMELVFTAAADHCLEPAYRGRCPGVEPDKLMEWRAASRAAFQGRDASAVLADVAWARQILRDEVAAWACPECFGSGMLPYQYPQEEVCGHCSGAGGGGPGRFADLRGRGIIPELPEAAAREGIAFVAEMKDRDGRVKVVLQAAGPELVRSFLAGSVVPGLSGVYGDPARGFAGGYV